MYQQIVDFVFLYRMSCLRDLHIAFTLDFQIYIVATFAVFVTPDPELESLANVKQTKNWSNSRHGGPKQVIREDLR